jgi:hypothetical protein
MFTWRVHNIILIIIYNAKHLKYIGEKRYDAMFVPPNLSANRIMHFIPACAFHWVEIDHEIFFLSEKNNARVQMSEYD